MQRLIDGYKAFRAGRWPEQRALFESLAGGQKPKFLIIACCDSRVDPSAIFGGLPGEFFIIRNVANLVPPFEQGEGLHGTSAALEFAVEQLKVETILVLGHAQCGGVAAALNPEAAAESIFMLPWITLMGPARDACTHSHDPQTALERESIRLSIERLRQFPFVAKAIAERGLSIEGARFGVADGRLELLDQNSGLFEELK